VARHFHFAPDLGDTAIVVDEKGRALDAEIFAAVRAFFLPRSIALDGASASMSTRRVASASCVRRPAATARTLWGRSVPHYSIDQIRQAKTSIGAGCASREVRVRR
jgi:hypothetical protein